MRADEKVSIDEASVAMAERQFGAVTAESVEAVHIIARLVADRALVFAASFYEEIVLHQTVGRRKASRAMPDVKGG